MNDVNTKWLELTRRGYVVELGFHTVPLVDEAVWGSLQTHHDEPTLKTPPYVPRRGLRVMRRQIWHTWLWTDAAGDAKRWDVIGSVYEMKPQRVFDVTLDQ
jgi:hypothetical protein